MEMVIQANHGNLQINVDPRDDDMMTVTLM